MSEATIAIAIATDNVIHFPASRLRRDHDGLVAAAAIDDATFAESPDDEGREAICEFAVDNPKMLSTLIGALLWRRAWFMVVPPEPDGAIWTLCVRLTSAHLVRTMLGVANDAGVAFRKNSVPHLV